MEGFSYIAICQIAEGFGKRSVVPNGIRRGGFAHSRKTGRFKAFAAGTHLFILLFQQVEILIST